MRSAAPDERVQDRARWLEIVVWPAAAGAAGGLPPAENCRPNRKERDAARSRGPPGRCCSGWLALGRIRAVTKISIPAEKTDSPVTATATWPVRPSSRVSIGTMPGNSASGGSHG